MPQRSRQPLGYETKHCIALMEWARLQAPILRELYLLVHIPNEGRRTKAEAGIAKAMGLKKGVWDYVLPVVRGRVPGLWIEMKKPGASLTPEQRWWGVQMAREGFSTYVAYQWPQAREAILAHLRGRRLHAEL